MHVTQYTFEDTPYFTRDQVFGQNALARIKAPTLGNALDAFLKTSPGIRIISAIPANLDQIPFAPNIGFIHLESGARARIVLDPKLALFAIDSALGSTEKRKTPRPLSPAEEGLLCAMLLAALDILPNPSLWALSEIGAKGISGVSVSFEISLGAFVGWAVLEIEERLAHLIPSSQKIPSWLKTHSLCGRVLLGKGSLPVEELASLQDSDIFIPDEVWVDEIGNGRASLQIAGLCGALNIEGFQATYIGGFMPDAKRIAEKATLEIEVELGRFQATIEEISNWNQGTILPLGQKPADPVSLVLQGKVIAKGEIVRVEGDLGVRLLWVADTKT